MLKKLRTAFELNEDLKENCILLGATKAITTHFKKGTPLLPEAFWETIIVIPSHKSLTHVKVIYSLVIAYMRTFERYGFECADPVLEYSHGEPRIIYAIFPGDLSFTKKLPNLTK